MIVSSAYMRHLHRCYFTRTLSVHLLDLLDDGSLNDDEEDHMTYEECLDIAEEAGSVPVPTSQPQTCVVPLATIDAKDTCPICLITNVEVVTNVCNHAFCLQCITRWMSTHHTCPICVSDFNAAALDPPQDIVAPEPNRSLLTHNTHASSSMPYV
jgi:hypothetical protein